MKTAQELIDYMAYLRRELDAVFAIDSSNITYTKEKAYIQVCHDMFDGLAYGLTEDKLATLATVLENYRREKETKK